MIIKCKMCGGDLDFEPGSTVCECEYCGSKQTIPSADNEKKTNLFNRANRLRMNSEFDKASAVYEQIVAEFPEEAEAYWGLCLCAYGIEYVDDPATGSKIPTCHRTLPTSIMEDSNFEQACDYADPVARKVYREEAKTIDRIQKDILSIAQNETPYDVFICYKETAEDGSRTEDSVLAQDVYEALTAKGLKVFFSRITLEDKLGTQYEPYIYAALSSAKVMLAFGTTYEYYDAVWVKNEWSRFLGMMKADKRKVLIPCFKGLDAYDMPKEFRGLQAQDMAKLGWMQDLVRGVEKLCGKGGTASSAPNTVVQKTVVQEVQENGKADNLMKRVYLYLEDRDFAKASEYIDKVLDVDAEYAPAYVAQVLVAKKLTKEANLTILRASIDDDPTWKKALRFANEEQKQRYLGYAKQISVNEAYDKEQRRLARERRVKQKQYHRALSAMNQKDYPVALLIFKKFGDYEESRKLFQQCISEYRNALATQLEDSNKAKLLLAQKELTEATQQVDLTQKKSSELTNATLEAENRKNKLQEQISRLNGEIDELRGLFIGRKKQMLINELTSLEREQTEIEQQQCWSEKETAKAHVELQAAKNALVQAQILLKAAEEEQKLEQPSWTDEEIEAKAIEVATQAGKYVTFGHYPQTKSGDDDNPIQWLILERDGQNALLISKCGLDTKPYDTNENGTTWEKSTLRMWLNAIFYNKAFNSAEQAIILTTSVDNNKEQCYSSWSKNDGNNTQDKIFLLSYAEVKKYFDVVYWKNAGPKENKKPRIAPTAYAIAQGASTFSLYKAVDGADSGWWWLRSLGQNGIEVAAVGASGCLHSFSAYETSASIRPAMWVNIDSLIKQV